MNHDEKLEAAKEAINKVFGDTSVGRETTKKSLEELIGDIEAMLDTL
jgi:hypothetical protein